MQIMIFSIVLNIYEGIRAMIQMHSVIIPGDGIISI